MHWGRGGQWHSLLSSDGRELVQLVTPLAPYEVRSFAEVDALLGRLEGFWRANMPLARALAVRKGRVLAPIPDQVCSLLETTGPLRRVPPWSYSNDFGRECPPSSFEVAEVMRDVQLLADTWQEVSARPTGTRREKLVGTLEEVGLPVLQREMELVPRFRDAAFGYDVAPGTLRAVLWERLFRVFDRGLRAVCKYCGEPFEPEPTLGRAYQYCPPHRTSACRQAVLKARAPANRFPGRFDLNQEGISDG